MGVAGDRGLTPYHLGLCQAILQLQPHWLPLPGTLPAMRQLPLPSQPQLPLLAGSNTTLRKTLYVFQINAIKSIKVCER